MNKVLLILVFSAFEHQMMCPSNTDLLCLTAHWLPASASSSSTVLIWSSRSFIRLPFTKMCLPAAINPARARQHSCTRTALNSVCEDSTGLWIHPESSWVMKDLRAAVPSQTPFMPLHVWTAGHSDPNMDTKEPFLDIYSIKLIQNVLIVATDVSDFEHQVVWLDGNSKEQVWTM